MRKVFISLDTEGLSGLTSWKEMEADPTTAGKAYIRELQWVIDELFKSAPELEEITLCDSHSRGENLPYGSFNDPRITQIKGYPRQNYMMATLDSSYDMLMLIGYHAMIGSKYGLMDHSYSSAGIYNIRINSVPVGETELNCYYAAEKGVPLAMVAGDDILEQELKQTQLLPTYVRTKEGLGRFAAKLYEPQSLEPRFRKAVRDAVANTKQGKLPILLAKTPTTLEIDLMTTVMADAVEMIPSVERISGRTIKYVSSSFADIMHIILVTALLSGHFRNYS
ncbi:MAG: M55 family metallopeptidase [Spirochaetia bacterium]|jgi:D-amino peptidase|nr:M55 family metallopeptidase [Spirochaetia bacterium]